MITTFHSLIDTAREPFEQQVSRLVDEAAAAWWDCPVSLPDLGPLVAPRRQKENEKQLNRLIDGLSLELKRLPPGDPQAQAETRERILTGALDFAREIFDFTPEQIAVIRDNGLVEAWETFARAARAQDSALSGDDIYQAGRNVMTMNFLQILLGLPVGVTPAVLAYSLLYPYTDNFLDDPAVPLAAKMDFNRRFWQRLAGQPAAFAGPQQAHIWSLVTQVEAQWPRERFPQVYHSLLAIHAAQSRSLVQLRGPVSPYEVDVLRISFEKGGTSVLADGYLAAGDLDPQQARFAFAYGAYTQLMDDLEDVESDLRSGAQTVFSQTAGRWPLDALINRAVHLGQRTFSGMDQFAVPAAAPLQAMIMRVLPVLISASAGRLPRYVSPAYLRELEAHMPFRFGALNACQKRLARRKISLTGLLGA